MRTIVLTTMPTYTLTGAAVMRETPFGILTQYVSRVIIGRERYDRICDNQFMCLETGEIVFIEF